MTRRTGPVEGRIGIVVVCLGLWLQGCRFETRPPSGNGGGETALQGVVTGYYRALAVHDSLSLDTLTFGAATVLVAAGQSEPSLVPWRTLTQLPERRTATTGVRIIRTEMHLDGNFANVRVVVAGSEAIADTEFEATDLMTLAKRENGWRVAHLLLGPWRLRSAP